MPEKSIFTVKEFAAYLGIGLNMAYSLVNSKDFYPAFRLGRKCLINVEKLKKWIDEQDNQR